MSDRDQGASHSFPVEEGRRTARSATRDEYVRLPPPVPQRDKHNGHNGQHHHDHGPDDGYGQNDAENGRRLLDQHGEDLLYVKGRTDPWLVWDGTCWARDQTQQAEQWMESVMRTALAAVAAGYTPRHQVQGRAR